MLAIGSRSHTQLYVHVAQCVRIRSLELVQLSSISEYFYMCINRAKPKLPSIALIFLKNKIIKKNWLKNINNKDFTVIDFILKYALDSLIVHHMYNICKITYCTGK